MYSWGAHRVGSKHEEVLVGAGQAERNHRANQTETLHAADRLNLSAGIWPQQLNDFAMGDHDLKSEKVTKRQIAYYYLSQ